MTYSLKDSKSSYSSDKMNASSRYSSDDGLFQIISSTQVDKVIWNISGDVGLVSAGRINKDTPPLTTPSHTSKSSAMDISSYIF